MDDTARASPHINTPACGGDDALHPVPIPVSGAGHFRQALLGHFCQAPKTPSLLCRAPVGKLVKGFALVPLVAPYVVFQNAVFVQGPQDCGNTGFGGIDRVEVGTNDITGFKGPLKGLETCVWCESGFP